MVAIPFPVTTSPGHENHLESQGRLINAFAEQIDGSQKVKRVRVSGLSLRFTSGGTGGVTGLMLVSAEQRLYVTFENAIYRVQWPSPAGGMTLHHTFINPQDVSGGIHPMAHNNKVVPEPDKVALFNQPALILASGGIAPGGYPFDFAAAQGGQQPNSVCCVNGYFFFTFQNGAVMASDLNDTAVDPNSVALAISEPDLLIRGVNHFGRLVMFGTHSTEIWTDVGSTPFPFQRAASIPAGLLRYRMVAGFEDGFTAGLLWVGDDFTVKELQGYNAVTVSPPDLNRLIERSVSIDPFISNTPPGPRACCYVTQGHPIWQLTYDDPVEGWAWCYDLSTRKWHERASHLLPYSRIRTTVLDNDSSWLASDFTHASALYRIDPFNFTEGGNPLRVRIESAAVSAFPARTRVLRADFELETGVGETGGPSIETDPVVQISWSDDGGVTWGNPLTRALGQQAQYRDISVYNVGRTTRYGRRWRLDISDPVYVTLLGGDQTAQPRR